MATAADLLALMEMLDNELEMGSGEKDETPAILALRQSQHYFELLAATYPRVLGSTISPVTVANTETTVWNTTLRRLDAVWYLDVNGVPVRKLKRVEEIGGHVPSMPWPLQIALGTSAPGAPFGYFADMRNFYWLPKPDAGYTLRIYGFLKQIELADRAATFNYPDECKLPIAQFANKLLSIGVADDTVEYDKLASRLFTPLLRGYRRFDRSEPSSRYYTEFHTT